MHIENINTNLTAVYAIGEWLDTEHHIQDGVTLKAIAVAGGGGADAGGML